jgi:tetratricopeptide (TPR) repeat protein
MRGVDEVLELAKRGHVEEAVNRINELEDPLEQVEALTRVAEILNELDLGEWSIDLIQDAEYIVEHTKNPYIRAVGYSMIGLALHDLGYPEDGEEFFKSALDEITRIKEPMKTAEALARVASYIAITGATEYALRLFDTSLDIIVRAEMEYIRKTEAMATIADVIESTADKLPSPMAEKLYEMAFDILEKLHITQRAGTVEKKLLLSRTVRTAGFPEVREALLEGRYHYALALVERLFGGEERLIGSLEVALWMKKSNDPSYLDVLNRSLLESEEVEISQGSLKRVASLLAELEKPEAALRFALEIEEPLERSEALQKVAFSFFEGGEFEKAKLIAGGIPDPAIREQTLREINAMEPW